MLSQGFAFGSKWECACKSLTTRPRQLTDISAAELISFLSEIAHAWLDLRHLSNSGQRCLSDIISGNQGRI